MLLIPNSHFFLVDQPKTCHGFDRLTGSVTLKSIAWTIIHTCTFTDHKVLHSTDRPDVEHGNLCVSWSKRILHV